jgi:hypothetical protein
MNTIQDPDDPDALISLVQRAKAHYQAPPPSPPKRGRRPTYSARSFLLLAVVAVATQTFRDSQLRRLLERDDRLRQAVEFDGVPHRTSIGRRMARLVAEAEQQIALLGAEILAEVEPEAEQSQVSAIDGRMYEASGPAWHAKNRAEGRVPQGLRNVDTDSAWSKSGYRGWVQGYRLLLQGLVFPAPVPIFAAWRGNDVGEVTMADAALEAGQMQITDVLLGDTSFGGADFTSAYRAAGGWVLTPKQVPRKRRSWKDDLYEYRKETIELLFARIIEASGVKTCPVRGLGRNGAYVLASVWIYQICFLTNYRAGRPLAEIKQYLENARWRVAS